jgi:hypothetical protein
MSLTGLILKKFDELIAIGKKFPSRITNQDLIAQLYSWETSCLNLLEKTFGKESDYYRRMSRYCSRSVSINLRASYGVELLKSARKDFEELPPYIKQPKTEGALESMQFIQQLCSRFHIIARQLRERYNGRPTLDVSDEYDVQDLIHALLRINFEDIRPEEWTPSYAGGSSRMDFLLNKEGIVVETKKTRKNLGAKEISDQLIIDIERYSHHPNCKMLFCFVYDPEGRIANPEGLERDLSQDHDQTVVRVLVTPKGT